MFLHVDFVIHKDDIVKNETFFNQNACSFQPVFTPISKFGEEKKRQVKNTA